MLTLRDIRSSDRDLVLAWRNQPDVARWMFTDRVISPEEHAAWFAAMLRNPSMKYWVIEVDGVPQGVVQLTAISPTHQSCEWGMYLGEAAARGTGAAEGVSFLSLDAAFGELGMERVRCEVLATNERALRLYERVGFRREGSRCHISTSSVRHDVVVMSISRSEWGNLRPSVLTRLQQHNVIVC